MGKVEDGFLFYWGTPAGCLVTKRRKWVCRKGRIKTFLLRSGFIFSCYFKQLAWLALLRFTFLNSLVLPFHTGVITVLNMEGRLLAVSKKPGYKGFLPRKSLFPITWWFSLLRWGNWMAYLKKDRNAAAEYKRLLYVGRNGQPHFKCDRCFNYLKADINEKFPHNSSISICSKHPELGEPPNSCCHF